MNKYTVLLILAFIIKLICLIDIFMYVLTSRYFFHPFGAIILFIGATFLSLLVKRKSRS